MSQVNSEVFSSACDWNFKIEGDPSVNGVAGIDLGLTINPGILCTEGYANVLDPLVTTGNPAVDTLTIFFIVDIFPFTVILTDTINNINARFVNDWYAGARGPNTPNQPVMQNFSPIATPGVYQIRCASTAPMTAGRILINLLCTQLNIH